MLQEWERRFPGRIENVFRATTSIAPSQLADRNLFDFAGLGSRADAVRPSQADWLVGQREADPADED